MKEKEETKRLKRFQSATTAPFPLPAAPSIGLHPRARNINISNNIQIIVNIIIYRRSAIANDPSFVEETLINRKKCYNSTHAHTLMSLLEMRVV